MSRGSASASAVRGARCAVATVAAIRTELAAVMLHALLPVGLDVRGLDVKPELVDQRVAFGAGAAAQKLRARARERREREPERKAVGCRRERGETAQYGVRLRRRRTAVAFLLAQRLTLADLRLQAGRAAGGQVRPGQRRATSGGNAAGLWPTSAGKSHRKTSRARSPGRRQYCYCQCA